MQKLLKFILHPGAVNRTTGQSKVLQEAEKDDYCNLFIVAMFTGMRQGELNSCEYMENLGYEVTYMDVDEYGLVNVQDLEKKIRPDTTLITVMYGNNEIGTIEPIREIGCLAHQHEIVFHTDAVQAVGQIPISVKAPRESFSLILH